MVLYRSPKWKRHVIVIDEFSMLDFFLFRMAEGLCRKFAKNHTHDLPWGGRHIIMLGDPAQLPSSNCNSKVRHIRMCVWPRPLPQCMGGKHSYLYKHGKTSKCHNSNLEAWIDNPHHQIPSSYSFCAPIQNLCPPVPPWFSSFFLLSGWQASDTLSRKKSRYDVTATTWC